MSSRKNSEYHSYSFILPPKKRILREFQRRELQNHHDDSSVIPAAKKKRIHNHHDSFPELKKKVEKMGGYDLKMVIEKQLFQSDLNPITNGRFSIPEKKIHKEAKNFLKPHEIKWLERLTREGINVLVLDPKLREFNLVLKKWSMTYGYTYNLTHHWNDIVDCNDLKLHDTVQLWSFRRFNNKLGFALVKPSFLNKKGVRKRTETSWLKNRYTD